MIIADTGAVVALVDADDRHHGSLGRSFRKDPAAWLLPCVILAEVDYLLATQVGVRAQEAFLSDLADGSYSIEHSTKADLVRARDLCAKYRTLELGLVDAVVMSMAERLHATAIATLDLRHFGVVVLQGRPRLIPRDQ